MIIDKELEFCSEQDLGAANADAIGTNVIDIGAVGEAYDAPLRFLVTSQEIFNNRTTITIELYTADAAADLNTDVATSQAETLLHTATFAVADTAAGTVLIDTPLPSGAQQFLGIVVTGSGGSAQDTGKISAGLVRDTFDNDFSS